MTLSRIKEGLYATAYWLHITDGEGQLDIVDLSLIGIVIKMLFAPHLDWQAVCSMIPILASQMHNQHLDYLKSKLIPVKS